MSAALRLGAVLLFFLWAAVIALNIKPKPPAPVSVPYCLVQDTGIFWPCDEVWREYDI